MLLFRKYVKKNKALNKKCNEKFAILCSKTCLEAIVFRRFTKDLRETSKAFIINITRNYIHCTGWPRCQLTSTNREPCKKLEKNMLIFN